jgi:hypothetical protein
MSTRSGAYERVQVPNVEDMDKRTLAKHFAARHQTMGGYLGRREHNLDHEMYGDLRDHVHKEAEGMTLGQ